ncbi:MAG: 50S ribosomal protein L18 [Candidatus Raymondbacteria bacterium RifOxyA12_full_50_37]|uniref:Large ribosomal subunit protein uL18 n=1 Tax=Candidatus Raymondbacteria bacterium RIFOXYD12_FULL_49_13 TaxID=1817890 RepID=A0A1F7FDF4_UNCRA|nr:ribosomal protein L18 [uncultured bacterium]OGJ88093.1 MAG: 50S ribosomal protein L18 [Candidatus Raymondbacteria bacterium RifOxyA12_full_50_37]OGJ94070.1 MAG: 50S ribosomal protein L18 [Candidatus Raymondbacteria bacterium RIFOXYA2_FULL_49_16]OGJ96895.1 MAG: 50S ribosomal protein L18 [Candidatus Raymondbacteria bacterium RIFOXYC2_FULL_50_21]OGK04621.1 MAG: 50S ribosomal protein L18 [Candidatus Raymondbacteria bacterium RIFOXYD12_FULL_49_13]OGP41817.1 MAG: 50S ribosomal protein L18 [Candid
MSTYKSRHERREAKKKAIREKLMLSPGRPRLCIRRTLQHMIAQVVDDSKGVSLVQINSKALNIKGKKTAVAKELGKAMAEKLIAMGISKVVFDRSGYLYHGRVKALADGAREKGLVF